jgi:segregation and condensation protein A
MAIDDAGRSDGAGARDAAAHDTWRVPGPDEAPLQSEALIVDVDGFEGPLDLLLALARLQRVDIARISIVELVEQYLAFIADAAELRLEVAADYLVMAAWLIYLKSRLILPKDRPEAPDELPAEEMAKRLAFRLVRLDAMRTAADRLMTRKRLGRDVFFRGAPETIRIRRDRTHTAAINDLLAAYADLRRRTIKVGHVVAARRVWSIKDARVRLERMVADDPQLHLALDMFVVHHLPEMLREALTATPATVDTTPDPRTLIAASFGAILELTREGRIDVHQEAPFAPIHICPRTDAVGAVTPAPAEGSDGTT